MSKKGVVTGILILLALVFAGLLSVKMINKKSEPEKIDSDTALTDTIKISVLDYVYEINLIVSSNNMDTDLDNDILDGVYTVDELKKLGINRKGKVLTDGWVQIKYEQVSDYSIRYNFGKIYYVSNYLSISNTEVIKNGELRPMPKQ